jgi:long-chain acyl-CoA synthetase
MKSYLTQSLQRATQVNGNGIGTICGDRKRAWWEIKQRVARIAAAMRALGLEAGDRVALLGQNTDRYFELHFAVPWAGGVLLPLNTRLSAGELDYMLRDAGAAMLFVDAPNEALAAPLADATEAMKAVVFMSDRPSSGRLEYESLIEAHSPMPDAAPGGSALAGIFYTGGNTGRAKGVMLSHDNLVANAMNAIAMVGYDSSSVYLHVAPMFHLSDGMAIYSLTMLGGVHVFLPRFDAHEVMHLVAEHRVTNLTLVPTMIEMIVRQAEKQTYDVSSLRQIQFGAAPMPDATLQRLLDLWPDMRLAHGWGMTELAPIGTLLPPEWRQPAVAGEKLKSCGKAALNVELRIVDEAGSDVPPGEVGELIVRGPVVMLGYWNRPEETRQALRGGWLHTGDAARMDADGFVYIVDRLKDMIISGGFNIYSTEVENVISRIPGVAAVAVIGVPHELWGEAVHAIVVPEPNADLSAEHIIAVCKQSIASYKCPRSIEFRTEPLPLTGAGKILKRQLREERARAGV